MTLSELEAHVDRQLDSNPALEYVKWGAVVNSATSTADARIEPADDGAFEVTITPLVRELKIRKEFLSRSEHHDASEKDQVWVRNALWLLDSIERRESTVMKTIQAIVKIQHRFVVSGKEDDLVPIKMQAIADEVGLHVTTVSRAVSEKIVEMPHGLWPLRDGF